MELIFVVLIGIIIGLVARYAIPGRDTYGFMAQLALGAAVSAVAWVALTFLGMAWDGGWIWAITIVVTALACAAYGLFVPQVRNRKVDERYRELARS